MGREVDVQVPERLRSFLIDAFGSILNATRVTGVREASWYRYLSGHNAPSSDVFMTLAQHGCNLNWLLTGEGEMYANTEPGRSVKKSANERKRSELRQQ